VSFETVCQICESAPASHTCEHCGAQVCDDHFDEQLVACSRCAASIRGAGGEPDSPDPDPTGSDDSFGPMR